MTLAILTRCIELRLPMPVQRACAAIDWLCASRPGSQTHWMSTTETNRLILERQTRCGPPDTPHYLPHRRLHGVHRAARPALGERIELELLPWDANRSAITLRLRSRRPEPSAAQWAAIDHLAHLLSDTATRAEDDLDAAAIALLLDRPFTHSYLDPQPGAPT